jgi:Polysaccharide lyase
MSAPGCPVIASDTASDPNPLSFWSNIECQNTSRASAPTSGGDSHVMADGAAQPDSAYRQLKVFDGDDFSGERCELGRNDHRTGATTFYHEGDHRITYFSERLPDNFPLSTDTWQTVMQMKQTQPADGGDGVPILFMGAYENAWHVESSLAPNGYFSFPAQTGTWTRFAWDVKYSQDPNQGWLQVSADLNGDGDFNDPHERSPLIHGATLKTEVNGPNGTSDGLAPGDPIPDHLRIGLYHNPSISCAAPVDCSVGVDNVQVVAP